MSCAEICWKNSADLLYLRLDDRKQPVVNRRLFEDIVLDVGEDDRIVGIEILGASKHVSLEWKYPDSILVLRGRKQRV